jgi:D-3-phosphoglycerate dehydrogenase
VYEAEPVVDAQHPLLHMPNVLCTPHLGYAEHSSYEALYTVAVDQLLAFAVGQPINVANPEAISMRKES